MNRFLLLPAAMAAMALTAAIFAVSASPVLADDDDREKGGGSLKTRLTGYEEVLPVYTPASGDVSVRFEESPDRVIVTLRYEKLATAVQAAHLHWGQSGVTGPVILTLCGAQSGNTCPANGDQALFTFNAQAVQGVAAGTPTGFFPANDLNALRDGLRSGVVYANVHTQQFPGGEIRGQLGLGTRGGGDDGRESGQGNGKGKD